MLKRGMLVLLLLMMIVLPWYGSIWLDLRQAEQAWQEQAYGQAARHAAAAAARCGFCGPMWRRAGQAYAFDGDFAAAGQAFQRAERRDALSAADWLLWGKVQWQEAHPDKAIQTWQKGLEQYPEAADLWAALAYAAAFRRDELLERQALTHLLAHDDAPAWAHLRLALWLAADGNSAALTHLRQAAALDETLSAPAETLRLAFNQASALPSAEAARLLGQALGALGAWPQAEKAFARAVALQPADGESWAWLAEARQQMGQDASPAFQRALAAAPDSPLVQGLYGLFLTRQGEWDSALAAFQRAVALQPEDASWWPMLGEALAQTGDVASALDAYRRAAALTADQPQNWYLLGQFCFEYNIDLAGIGLSSALKAYLLDKTEPRYAALVGRYYMALNRVDDARKYLSLAWQEAPADPQTLLYWGIWQAQYGHPATARDLLTQALMVDSDSVRDQARYWLERLP